MTSVRLILTLPTNSHFISCVWTAEQRCLSAGQRHGKASEIANKPQKYQGAEQDGYTFTEMSFQPMMGHGVHSAGPQRARGGSFYYWTVLGSELGVSVGWDGVGAAKQLVGGRAEIRGRSGPQAWSRSLVHQQQGIEFDAATGSQR